MDRIISLELIGKEEEALTKQKDSLTNDLKTIDRLLEALHVLKDGYGKDIHVNIEDEITLYDTDSINANNIARQVRGLPTVHTDYSTDLTKVNKVYWVVLKRGGGFVEDITNMLLEIEPTIGEYDSVFKMVKNCLWILETRSKVIKSIKEGRKNRYFIHK